MLSAAPAFGLDFGTTNSVLAVADAGGSRLIPLDTPAGPEPTFRSALCFWEEEAVRGGIAAEAGPWAIAEYSDFPQGCRFLQSFKSVAASTAFEHATVFQKRLRFEDLGKVFLEKLAKRSGGALKMPGRVVVGRPVEFAGARPDAELAQQRYDAMFAAIGAEVHYVYEPLGAAFSYASRSSETATVLVADFGGGTSDFSIVRIGAPGSGRRCEPLGHAGIGIAGDRFDYRIMDHLVTPLLGKGGAYRSFDKILEIPAGYFADLGDWSRLALMRNRKTLEELERLRRAAIDPEAIGRIIAVIEEELGLQLYAAVAQVKRDLSSAETAHFHFAGAGLAIEADISRAMFEQWIAPDVQRIAATVDQAIAHAGIEAAAIDRVFLTGGSSLIPCIRRMFAERFGADRIASGGELTSIAHGLALIAQQEDIGAWTVRS